MALGFTLSNLLLVLFSVDSLGFVGNYYSNKFAVYVCPATFLIYFDAFVSMKYPFKSCFVLLLEFLCKIIVANLVSYLDMYC